MAPRPGAPPPPPPAGASGWPRARHPPAPTCQGGTSDWTDSESALDQAAGLRTSEHRVQTDRIQFLLVTASGRPPSAKVRGAGR